MNLKAYHIRDSLYKTIHTMAFVETREELNRLFVEAIQELLEYQTELRKDIKM